MENFPEKLNEKFKERSKENALRKLGASNSLVDFSSNDYLDFAQSEAVFEKATKILKDRGLRQNGSTGSRLLSGNSGFYEETENKIADFHQAESALVFNSGYDANLGFFSCVPQRGDLVFYDELVHASIRDGIRLGLAKAVKFKHNDLDDLKKKIEQSPLLSTTGKGSPNEIYVVTESVFSMDGDSPDLEAFAGFCAENGFRLVVDEAHAIGVLGENGEGLTQKSNFQNKVFARLVTFGKALGCHGAAILGSENLKNYLVNFARSFIYTTALPPHSIASIQAAYDELEKNPIPREKLRENIEYFKTGIRENNLEKFFVPSNSAIHCCQIPGNENVKKLSEVLRKNGFDVKPILSPTVPKGKERLRFCLHSYNSKEEISGVLKIISKMNTQNVF
jgi:8-amino-7-oxononanoate synthase